MKKYENKKVLITGGLGFLGSNLALNLVFLGAKVTIVDNFQFEHGANLFNIDKIKNKVTVNICDIRDESAMNKLIQGQDLIFNIAAQTSHAESMKNPFLDLDINCRGNLILLEACQNYNPNVRIIYIGTRAFYGYAKKIPVSEFASINPIDFYGVHRYSAEVYHLLYYKMHGIRSVSIRLSNCYGPHGQMLHSKYSVINWFIRMAIENEPIKIFGEGKQLRDYLYVEDAVNALLLIAQTDKIDGQVFNLGGSEGYSLINIAEKILNISKSSGKIEHVPWPKLSKSIESGDFVTDVGKIKKTIKWSPKINLDEGIAKTVEYYKLNKKHYW